MQGEYYFELLRELAAHLAPSAQSLADKVPPFNRLIVNAGYANGATELLKEGDDAVPADLLKMLDTNVVGPVKTVRAFLPTLKKAESSDGKKILLMGSIMGSVAAVDFIGSAAAGYSVSKSALNMVGRKMSVELKDSGVSVMIMHPGWVKTVGVCRLIRCWTSLTRPEFAGHGNRQGADREARQYRRNAQGLRDRREWFLP